MKRPYDFEDWLHHVHTETLLGKYEPELRRAHSDLLQLCSQTTDAEVRGALERYRGLEKMVQELKGQRYQKERSEDE